MLNRKGDSAPQLQAKLTNAKAFVSKLGKMPTQANLLETLMENGNYSHEFLSDCFDSARICVHPKVLGAAKDFLAWKMKYGTEDEKKIYREIGSIENFILRLTNNRPLAFLTESDSWTKLGGPHGTETGYGWENPDLNQYMSYDEIKLAALINVSSTTAFINDGNRYNRGQPGEPGTYVKEGSIIAAVGARFERTSSMDGGPRMEWEECVVDKAACPQRGYGKGESTPQREFRSIFANLYGMPENFPTLEDVESGSYKGNFEKLSSGTYLNMDAYKARMKLTIELCLWDANRRAQEMGKKAWVHAVGLGLGVWQVTEKQVQPFSEAFRECLNEMNLDHIGVIDFSWVSGMEACLPWSERTRNQNISIETSKRPPHALLPKEREDHWIVEIFAWDGNSFPGNEYWEGSLDDSGDPAAACASMIPETHNVHINPRMGEKGAISYYNLPGSK